MERALRAWQSGAQASSRYTCSTRPLPDPPPPAELLADDRVRLGRIDIRLTADPTVLGAVGHSGSEVDDAHRREGYAGRALRLVRNVARHHGVAPLWVLIAPENTASRRTAERAGFRLGDVVAAAPEALALGLEPRLCRSVAEHP